MPIPIIHLIYDIIFEEITIAVQYSQSVRLAKLSKEGLKSVAVNVQTCKRLNS